MGSNPTKPITVGNKDELEVGTTDGASLDVKVGDSLGLIEGMRLGAPELTVGRSLGL